PSMKPLLVLLGRGIFLYHTVAVDPLERPSQNPDLATRTLSKMCFVREPHTPPIFLRPILLKHLPGVLATLCFKSRRPILLLASDTTSEIKLSKRPTNGTSRDLYIEPCRRGNCVP